MAPTMLNQQIPLGVESLAQQPVVQGQSGMMENLMD
jgi:hypothetical protein